MLVRTIESQWQPTALRPAAAASSLLDLFSLTSFPLMGETQRFVVFGTDSAPRERSASPARGPAPARRRPAAARAAHDPGFLDRPFDEIEFDRMIALAEQLVANLPVPTGR